MKGIVLAGGTGSRLFPLTFRRGAKRMLNVKMQPLPLLPMYQQIGSATSVLIIESFIMIAIFTYIQNNGLKLIGGNKNV